MHRFEKISADEAKSKRKDHLRSTAGGDAIAKAMKAPPSWDKDSRKARFIMTTQQVDRYRDIVVTAGGDTTEFERNPVGLLFHNSRTWPVAQWDGVAKLLKGRPPRMEGDFVLAPADGPGEIGLRVAEAEFAIANGIVRACSIGFIPNWDEIERIMDDDGHWTGGFKFNEWELIECSVCAIPANPGAMAKSADGDPQLALELIEDVLDNWARSPAGLLMPRAEYEAAHREIAGEPKTVIVVENSNAFDALLTSGLAMINTEVSKIVKAAIANGDGPALETSDDVHDCSLETVNRLASREVLYCTEFSRGEKTFGGLIVAASWAAAEEVATDRGLGEKVVGQVVSVEKDADGRIKIKSMLAREMTTEFLIRKIDEVADQAVTLGIDLIGAGAPKVGADGSVWLTVAKVDPATEYLQLQQIENVGTRVLNNSWPRRLDIHQSLLESSTLKWGVARSGNDVIFTMINGTAVYACLGVLDNDCYALHLVSGSLQAIPTPAEIAATPLKERASLIQRIRDILLGHAPEASLEPVQPSEPVLATVEQIEAARARSAALKQRLVDKGLLAA